MTAGTNEPETWLAEGWIGALISVKVMGEPCRMDSPNRAITQASLSKVSAARSAKIPDRLAPPR